MRESETGVYAVNTDCPSFQKSDCPMVFRSWCIIAYLLFLRLGVVLVVDSRHLGVVDL